MPRNPPIRILVRGKALWNGSFDILTNWSYLRPSVFQTLETMKADIESFRQAVYAIVASIPSGKVMSYGQIAWLAGMPRHARLVGRILGEVPASLNLPCHRVVNSQGRTAPHWHEQTDRLHAEGVLFRPNGCVDLKRCGWNLNTEVGDPD